MSLPRWFYGLSAVTMLTLTGMLAYGWLLSYRFAQKKLETCIDDTVQAAAKQIQDANYSCYDLIKVASDKEYKEKMAFAAGITENRAPIAISFDTSELQQAAKKEDSVKITVYSPDGKTTTKKSFPRASTSMSVTTHGRIKSYSFTTTTPGPASGAKRHIDATPAQTNPNVKTVASLDTLLQQRLTGGMGIPYQLQKQEKFRQQTAHLTRPFIINFFAPDVYTVSYTIATSQIVHATLPYMLVALVVLLLTGGAFLLYGRSYKMQRQVAQFREAMFSNVTHELKTPLSSIQLVIDALNIPGSGLSGQQQQQVSFAAKELTRMELLIEKILSFGKLNKEQLALTKELVDMGLLAGEAANIVSVGLADKSGALDIVRPPAPAIVKGDRVLLLNMLVSITDNAIKYAVQAPQIHICITGTPTTVVITIADNGPGIESRYHQKIFEPFFRMPTGDRHNIKGHGLGLSFARQVAILHNGTITLQSKPGDGSTFIIILPC